jgi:hypothetical protein
MTSANQPSVMRPPRTLVEADAEPFGVFTGRRVVQDGTEVGAAVGETGDDPVAADAELADLKVHVREGTGRIGLGERLKGVLALEDAQAAAVPDHSSDMKLVCCELPPERGLNGARGRD